MIAKTREFITKNGITQSMLARSIGVSAAQISQYLKDEYKGDVAGLETKLNDFMANYTVRNDILATKVTPTRDMEMVHFTINEAIIGRDLAVIYGEAGSGKTTAVKEFIKSNPTAVFVEAIPGMGISSVLSEISIAIGLQPSKNSESMIRAIAKEFKRREAVLIIDEAENLTTKTLEAIRRIWDFSEVPTVLVGTFALINNLKGRNGELLQLYSRVSSTWKFRGLSEDDLKALFGDVWEHIAKITTHLRRAMNIYKKATRFAKLKNEQLNASHIQQASSMMILG
jgi:hypothetical protein